MVSRETVARFVHDVVVKDHPMLEGQVSVTYAPKDDGTTFRAKKSQGQIRLSFHIMPLDDEFQWAVKRARRACLEIRFGTGIATEIAGQRRTRA